IVTQAGVNGEKEVTEEIQYVNGVEVSRETVSETVTVEPQDEVITVGSKAYDGEIITGSGTMAFPAPNYQFISRGYTAGYHLGIDIAIASGSPIYAADSGTVIVSQWTDSGYGYYIIIDHGNGLKTLYGHCSQLLVSVGENVTKGQLIALSGSTGNSTGPHLHFEVRLNDVKIDPAPFIF
ncbi:MAG: peptidoglycan DD-metalloendopeptidase family protein, partial [Oscillospiraceae bacterium]